MYGEALRYSCTVLSDGSWIAEIAFGFAGSVAVLVCTSLVCTSGLAMYFRKSAHAGPALTAQEKPSPPPSAVPGVPLPPSTVGKGNQLSFEANCLSSVSGIIVGSSQSPCSSIAALPLAMRPAELPAPCCAGVPRNASWKGLVSRNFLRSSPAFTQ